MLPHVLHGGASSWFWIAANSWPLGAAGSVLTLASPVPEFRPAPPPAAGAELVCWRTFGFSSLGSTRLAGAAVLRSVTSWVGFDLDDETNPGIQVVRSKRPQVFADVSNHPHFASQRHGSGRIRGWLCVPMIVGDRVIGVLSIDKFEPDFYTEELAELATAFAAQAAMAIENARLLETERAARQQAETLRAAAESLGSMLGMSEVFDLILSELGKVVPYRSASIQQLDGDEFEIIAGHGYPDIDELLGHRYACRGPDDPAWGLVERHETLIVSNASERYPQFEDVHGDGSIKTWMAVPLLIGDRLIGMLTFDSFEPDFYTDEHANDGQGLRRVRGDRDRQGALCHRAPACPGGGARGERGEERLPRVDEPRDPHADERHHRDERTPASHRRSTPSSRSPRRSSVRAAKRCSRSSTTFSTSRRSRPGGWSSRSRPSTSGPASTASSR